MTVDYQSLDYSECNMTAVDCRDVAGGSAVVFSSRCPGKETPNEDSAALIGVDEESGVLVVADGVGGGRAGAQASRLVLEAMFDAFNDLAEQSQALAMFDREADAAPLRTTILNGIETANERVLKLGLGAASTLAVVEIRSDTIRPYHVGDSMIVVTGQRGKLKLWTVSHSPVGFAIEAGVLDEQEAMHHEDRHLVSNVVGAAEMRIEIGPSIKLAAKDTLLLASDGLFDNLHAEEIINTIRRGPLAAAVETLAQAARKRMEEPAEGQPSKPDDLTIVAFRRKINHQRVATAE